MYSHSNHYQTFCNVYSLTHYVYLFQFLFFYILDVCTPSPCMNCRNGITHHVPLCASPPHLIVYSSFLFGTLVAFITIFISFDESSSSSNVVYIVVCSLDQKRESRSKVTWIWDIQKRTTTDECQFSRLWPLNLTQTNLFFFLVQYELRHRTKSFT